MGSALIFILLYLTIKSCWCEKFNILVINDKNNKIAEKALTAALAYLERNPRHGVEMEEPVMVLNDGEDGQEFLDSICAVYQKSLEQNKPPDLVVDLTLAGTVSEAAKTFSSALALPTVATAYGQEHDIRLWSHGLDRLGAEFLQASDSRKKDIVSSTGAIKTWRYLDNEQQKYLVQVSPPGDIVPEVVRSFAIYQNLTNAGVLFDSSFEMDHKYKALLRNLPTRHILVRVEEPKAIKEQLIRLRNLDIVNFFILGNLTTIKSVLDMANVNRYFNKKFAWHAITQEKGQLKCSCSNATILFVKPELDQSGFEQINTLRTAYSLTAQPEIVAAFYFDVIVRSILAIKSMTASNEDFKNMSYISCEEYNEEFPPRRINFDFRKHFMEETSDMGTACGNKQCKCVSLTFEVNPQGDTTAKIILDHLTALENNMAQYFPNITVEKFDWCTILFSWAAMPSEYILVLRKKSSLQIFRRIEHYN
ncbi:hypothetical protein J6590_065156 [Homalodisca vitripennis]|nr:hypothetical protein J6590_065156 [Homalodisca vitripennis]